MEVKADKAGDPELGHNQWQALEAMGSLILDAHKDSRRDERGIPVALDAVVRHNRCEPARESRPLLRGWPPF